jgi:hypothetical protein
MRHGRAGTPQRAPKRANAPPAAAEAAGKVVGPFSAGCRGVYSGMPWSWYRAFSALLASPIGPNHFS